MSRRVQRRLQPRDDALMVLRIFTGRGQLHVAVTVLQALVLFGHSQGILIIHQPSLQSGPLAPRSDETPSGGVPIQRCEKVGKTGTRAQ